MLYYKKNILFYTIICIFKVKNIYLFLEMGISISLNHKKFNFLQCFLFSKWIIKMSNSYENTKIILFLVAKILK